jgi:hypothetical protein
MVEQILQNCPWKESDISHGGAKVDWARIFLPKQEGGFRITNIEVWTEWLCSNTFGTFVLTVTNLSGLIGKILPY